MSENPHCCWFQCSRCLQGEWNGETHSASCMLKTNFLLRWNVWKSYFVSMFSVSAERVERWDPLGIMHVENKLFITLECLKSLVPVGFNVLCVYRESGTVRPTRHHACWKQTFFFDGMSKNPSSRWFQCSRCLQGEWNGESCATWCMMKTNIMAPTVSTPKNSLGGQTGSIKASRQQEMQRKQQRDFLLQIIFAKVPGEPQSLGQGAKILAEAVAFGPFPGLAAFAQGEVSYPCGSWRFTLWEDLMVSCSMKRLAVPGY